MKLKSIFNRMIFYSPKAHINSLWKEIFKLSFKIGSLKGVWYPYGDTLRKDRYEIEREKKRKIINALLDYYFDDEKDKEYIEENKAKK
ncbi:MAG: hypothetical protein AAB351_03720 [Patescibacteria group bacterium]